MTLSSSFSLAPLEAIFDSASLPASPAQTDEERWEILQRVDGNTRAQIQELEFAVSAAMEVRCGFPQGHHNELRHLYVPLSERESFRHANAILGNVAMDPYTINILSDWYLESNAERAFTCLLTKALRFRDFRALYAACLLKAAELCEAHGSSTDARRLLTAVVSSVSSTSFDGSHQEFPVWGWYYAEARSRLHLPSTDLSAFMSG